MEPKKKKLSKKQETFVKEYLVDLNATHAAIRAGYSEKTAKQIGFQNLRKDHIAIQVSAAMQKRSEETRIDSNYVLHRLTEIDQMDVLDILNNNGSVKSVSEWPKIWRQFISGFDVSEVFTGGGDDRELSGLLKKIKWPDKIKNLELIGKHVDVQAFKEQVGHSGELTVSLDEVFQRINGTTKVVDAD